ncbi:hypothetical protein [Rhodobacter sp. JA431]|uniref:hypothetical protein n=1 Tax=Rhodobacter sp. JA431 TaxID=570013 RepID=UPI000BE36C75|nr:hypothetical protein [Rhodobacter sp. JA431]
MTQIQQIAKLGHKSFEGAPLARFTQRATRHVFCKLQITANLSTSHGHQLNPLNLDFAADFRLALPILKFDGHDLIFVSTKAEQDRRSKLEAGRRVRKQRLMGPDFSAPRIDGAVLCGHSFPSRHGLPEHLDKPGRSQPRSIR